MATPAIRYAQGVTSLTPKSTLAPTMGDLLGFDGTDWVLADADLRVPAQFMAMETVAAGKALGVCRAGVLTDTDAPYTLGKDQYLSATGGAHTGTIPGATSTLTILQKVGIALSTTEVSFDLTQRGPMVLRASVTVSPPPIASLGMANVAVTVTGIANDDVIDSIPPTTFELLGIQRGHASTNTITIRLFNAASVTVTASAGAWTFVVYRF